MRIVTRSGVVASLATLVSAAPSARGDAVEVGGYAGVTRTNIRTTYDCPEDADQSWPCISSANPHHGGQGLTLGAYVRYAAPRLISFEADLMYATKGFGGSPPTVRFHYVEAPLLVRFDPLGDRTNVRVFAEAGLAPAIRVWCHASGEAFDNDTREVFAYSGACRDAPVTNETPSLFDLGAMIGAGVGVKLGASVIELQVRYARSLLDIEPDEGGKTVNEALYVVVGFGRALRR